MMLLRRIESFLSLYEICRTQLGSSQIHFFMLRI